MNHALDAVLARVAAGELTPDEAIALLDGRDELPGHPLPAPDLPRPASPPSPFTPPEAATTEVARRLVVRTSSRSVQIWGDPSISEISITGGHQVLREGDALVIENSTGAPGRFSLLSVPSVLGRATDNLVIRVNPRIHVDVDAAASAVKANHLDAGLRLHLLASSAKLDHVSGPLEVEAMTSSVKGTIRPTGQSRIDCESASVKVSLLAGSDVHIHGRNRMGKVVLPTSRSKGALAEAELHEATVGPGQGSLTIDAVMSSVMIDVEP